jgi:hypothetical protein
MRFSCSGLFPKPELLRLRTLMNMVCQQGAETVGRWCATTPAYFEKAAAKVNQSLHKTFKEIAGKSGDTFNIMVLNNDTLPMFELIALPEYHDLEVARPGEISLFRYEVGVGYRNILNWQLVHAYKFK